MAKKIKPDPPDVSDILSHTDVPDELKYLKCFQEVWAEWVEYKQEECCDLNGNIKPWMSIKAAQRWLTQIRNQYINHDRDVVHVISQSMLNEWVGIRFDLIEDRTSPLKSKTRDQVSGLDTEWMRVNTDQKHLN